MKLYNKLNSFVDSAKLPLSHISQNKKAIATNALASGACMIALSILLNQPMTIVTAITITATSLIIGSSLSMIKRSEAGSGLVQKVINHVKAYSFLYGALAGVSFMLATNRSFKCIEMLGPWGTVEMEDMACKKQNHKDCLSISKSYLEMLERHSNQCGYTFGSIFSR